jgi:CRP-like cAMP-binding protein
MGMSAGAPGPIITSVPSSRAGASGPASRHDGFTGASSPGAGSSNGAHGSATNSVAPTPAPGYAPAAPGGPLAQTILSRRGSAEEIGGSWGVGGSSGGGGGGYPPVSPHGSSSISAGTGSISRLRRGTNSNRAAGPPLSAYLRELSSSAASTIGGDGSVKDGGDGGSTNGDGDDVGSVLGDDDYDVDRMSFNGFLDYNSPGSGFEKMLHSDVSDTEALDMLLNLQAESSPLFVHFSHADLTALASVLSVMCFEDQETVITKGENATFAAIVLSGSFEVIVSNNLRFPVLTGETLGEMAFFESGKRSASVVASSSDGGAPAVLGTIRFVELERLHYVHPALLAKLTHMLAVASLSKLRLTISRLHDIRVTSELHNERLQEQVRSLGAEPVPSEDVTADQIQQRQQQQQEDDRRRQQEERDRQERLQQGNASPDPEQQQQQQQQLGRPHGGDGDDGTVAGVSADAPAVNAIAGAPHNVGQASLPTADKDAATGARLDTDGLPTLSAHQSFSASGQPPRGSPTGSLVAGPGQLLLPAGPPRLSGTLGVPLLPTPTLGHTPSHPSQLRLLRPSSSLPHSSHESSAASSPSLAGLPAPHMLIDPISAEAMDVANAISRAQSRMGLAVPHSSTESRSGPSFGDHAAPNSAADGAAGTHAGARTPSVVEQHRRLANSIAAGRAGLDTELFNSDSTEDAAADLLVASVRGSHGGGGLGLGLAGGLSPAHSKGELALNGGSGGTKNLRASGSSFSNGPGPVIVVDSSDSSSVASSSSSGGGGASGGAGDGVGVGLGINAQSAGVPAMKVPLSPKAEGGTPNSQVRVGQQGDQEQQQQQQQQQGTTAGSGDKSTGTGTFAAAAGGKDGSNGSKSEEGKDNSSGTSKDSSSGAKDGSAAAGAGGVAGSGKEAGGAGAGKDSGAAAGAKPATGSGTHAAGKKILGTTAEEPETQPTESLYARRLQQQRGRQRNSIVSTSAAAPGGSAAASTPTGLISPSAAAAASGDVSSMSHVVIDRRTVSVPNLTAAKKVIVSLQAKMGELARRVHELSRADAEHRSSARKQREALKAEREVVAELRGEVTELKDAVEKHKTVSGESEKTSRENFTVVQSRAKELEQQIVEVERALKQKESECTQLDTRYNELNASSKTIFNRMYLKLLYNAAAHKRYATELVKAKRRQEAAESQLGRTDEAISTLEKERSKALQESDSQRMNLRLQEQRLRSFAMNSLAHKATLRRQRLALIALPVLMHIKFFRLRRAVCTLAEHVKLILCRLWEDLAQHVQDPSVYAIGGDSYLLRSPGDAFDMRREVRERVQQLRGERRVMACVEVIVADVAKVEELCSAQLEASQRRMRDVQERADACLAQQSRTRTVEDENTRLARRVDVLERQMREREEEASRLTLAEQTELAAKRQHAASLKRSVRTMTQDLRQLRADKAAMEEGLKKFAIAARLFTGQCEWNLQQQRLFTLRAELKHKAHVAKLHGNTAEHRAALAELAELPAPSPPLPLAVPPTPALVDPATLQGLQHGSQHGDDSAPLASPSASASAAAAGGGGRTASAGDYDDAAFDDATTLAPEGSELALAGDSRSYSGSARARNPAPPRTAGAGGSSSSSTRPSGVGSDDSAYLRWLAHVAGATNVSPASPGRSHAHAHESVATAACSAQPADSAPDSFGPPPAHSRLPSLSGVGSGSGRDSALSGGGGKTFLPEPASYYAGLVGGAPAAAVAGPHDGPVHGDAVAQQQQLEHDALIAHAQRRAQQQYAEMYESGAAAANAGPQYQFAVASLRQPSGGGSGAAAASTGAHGPLAPKPAGMRIGLALDQSPSAAASAAAAAATSSARRRKGSTSSGDQPASPYAQSAQSRTGGASARGGPRTARQNSVGGTTFGALTGTGPGSIAAGGSTSGAYDLPRLGSGTFRR